MSTFSDRLNAARGDESIRSVARRAATKAPVGESTLYPYFRDGHPRPTMAVVVALAMALKIPSQELRELADIPAEGHAWMPPQEARYMNDRQRHAVDELIRSFVATQGATDADPSPAATPATTEDAQGEASPREKTEPALAAVREFVTLDIAALRALDDLLAHHDAALLTLFAREGSTDEADKLLLEGWGNLMGSATERAAASSWPESPTWNVAKDYLERWNTRMKSTGNRLGPLTEQRRRPPMTDAEAAAYIDAVDQMNDAKKQLNQVDHDRLNELRQQIEEMADALTEGETLIAQSVDETVRLADEFRATALRTYRDQLAAAEAAHEAATSSGPATEDAAIRRAKHALPRASSVSDMQAERGADSEHPAGAPIPASPEGMRAGERRARFEVYEDNAGKFRFRIKAGNGEVLASGQAYASRKGAHYGAAAVVRAVEAARVDPELENLLRQSDHALAAAKRKGAKGSDPAGLDEGED